MTDDPTAVARALAAWGLEGAGASSMRGGAVNEHWLVEPATGPHHVLRRYNPRHAAEATAYEHDLLAFLAGRDWPVAAPVPAADGSMVVQTEDGRWSLFPYLPGGPPRNDRRSLLRMGALLALLQTDLRAWDSPGQRPTFSRVTDLDTYVLPDGYRSYAEVLGWFEGIDARRAAALDGARVRNVEALEALGYADLPDQVIYNECLGNNVLFEGDTVTGILDFDFAHEDARVADIGRSLAVDCGADAAKVHSWMTGYTAHAEPPLSPDEAAMLPAMMVANEIWNAVVPLSIASRTGDVWMLESTRESIDDRLPDLEAAQPELGRVARVVAGHPQPGTVEP